jgi:hypothetical protein
MNPVVQKLADIDNRSGPENTTMPKLDDLVLPPGNKTKIIRDWEAVSLKLQRLEKIDKDLMTRFGSIQTFLIEDGGFQLGIHGEGPVAKFKGRDCPQASSTFFNINKVGEVTYAETTLSPYGIDSSGWGLEYKGNYKSDNIPFTAQDVIDEILSHFL